MPDHLHCIIRLNDSDLGRSIKAFKGKCSLRINRFCNLSGSLWQKGYFDHKFRSDEDLGPILSYLWNNPEIPGTNFRCNRDDWVWFKSLVINDVN